MSNTSHVSPVAITVENAVFVTFMLLISLTGALTNAVVIFSIFANQNLRTTTNYIVFNLATSDFFVATVAIPLRLLGELNSSKASLVPCNVVIAFTVLFDGLSRLNIVVLTCERFVAVRFPFFCWVSLGIFSTSLLNGVGIQEKHDARNMELARDTSKICILSTTLSEAAVIIFTIVFCLIPILIVVPLNCYLIKVSYRQMKKIHDLLVSVEANLDEQQSTREQNEFSVKQRKVARMVAVLVCLFVFLVAPITIIDLIETLGKVVVPYYLSKIAVCTIYLNAAVDMFVFAAFNKTFREAFRGIFVQIRAFVCHPCS